MPFATAAVHGTTAGHRRVMHRTTVADAGSTVADAPESTVSAAREPDVARGRAQLEAIRAQR